MLQNNTSSAVEYYPVTVVGVGSAGCTAVQNLLRMGITTDGYVCLDRDAEKLPHGDAVKAVKLDAGEDAAECVKEQADAISTALGSPKAVCVLAGLGGSVASKAAPIVCDFVREMGARLGVCVTMPFRFEGEKRMTVARESLEAMRKGAAVESVFALDDTLHRDEAGNRLSMAQMLDAYNLSIVKVLGSMAKLM